MLATFQNFSSYSLITADPASEQPWLRKCRKTKWKEPCLLDLREESHLAIGHL